MKKHYIAVHTPYPDDPEGDPILCASSSITELRQMVEESVEDGTVDLNGAAIEECVSVYQKVGEFRRPPGLGYSSVGDDNQEKPQE